MDDWQKLEWVLIFLNCTKEDKRVMGINDITTMNTYIDASYGVHPNMRGHTGRTTTLGKEIIHYKSSKQKIKVKSSAECKLVGLSKYIPYSLWIGYF